MSVVNDSYRPVAHVFLASSVVTRMTSLVDSEAHLRKRAEEMMMSDRGIRALIARGITTLGKLAFAHGLPGVIIVSAEFDTFSQDVLGAMASIGDRAVLKRLLFEGHTFVISQLKEQVTNPEAAQSRKIPQVERDARMADLKRRLPGVLIERQMSPSHALLDMCAQQFESRQLKYLSPDRCTSREWEVSMSKSAKQIEIDTDKLVVKEKAETPDCTTTGEMETFEALRRRGVAYAFVDILSWEVHERYLMMLFGHSRRPPPQGYQETTLQQVLRADRAVFTKLIQDNIGLRRDATTGDLPMDQAIINALSSYDVGFHLMPLPKPSHPTPPPKADPVKLNDQWTNPYNQFYRWSPYKGHEGGKGKGKGFKGKDRTNLLPKALQNRDNVSTDPHHRRLCFGFNLGRCDAAPAGGECKHGWHLCCRRNCQAPHPESEHDRQSKGS